MLAPVFIQGEGKSGQLITYLLETLAVEQLEQPGDVEHDALILDAGEKGVFLRIYIKTDLLVFALKQQVETSFNFELLPYNDLIGRFLDKAEELVVGFLAVDQLGLLKQDVPRHRFYEAFHVQQLRQRLDVQLSDFELVACKLELVFLGTFARTLHAQDGVLACHDLGHAPLAQSALGLVLYDNRLILEEIQIAQVFE